MYTGIMNGRAYVIKRVHFYRRNLKKNLKSVGWWPDPDVLLGVRKKIRILASQGSFPRNTKSPTAIMMVLVA